MRLSLVLFLVACGDNSRNTGTTGTTFLKDMSVGGTTTGGTTGTTTAGTTGSTTGGGGDMGGTTGGGGGCNPTDPMTDGQACPGGGCPAGQVGVTDGAGCKCWLKCDPGMPSQCPCDRRCADLVSGDMGVVAGACLLANSPGQRCGQTGGAGLNAEGCAQNQLCVNADTAGMFRYCIYDCTGNLPCPAQTMCLALNGVSTMACVYDSAMGGIAAGMPCMSTQACAEGLLCDTTCKPQCDRTGGTCASGTCTALVDAGRTYGYVCK